MDGITFGTPQFEDAPHDTVAPGHDSQAVDELDINDPRFTSEILDVNTEGDAYAFPAPPPDGKYRVKLKLQQRENAKKEKVNFTPAIWGKNQQPVLVASVEADIIDPSGKYDGVKVFDSNVSTFVQGNDKAAKVTTILARLRKPDGTVWAPANAKLGLSAWMELFVKALAGEPEIGIETVWEWSCQGCGKLAKEKGEAYPRAILGMHKFPPNTGGKPGYQPEMKCQVNPAHGYSRARVTIGRFLHLSELK
jgi:hypothetical protein